MRLISMKYVFCLLSIAFFTSLQAAAQTWAPGGPIPDEEYRFFSEIRGTSPKANLVIAERTESVRIVQPDDPNIILNSSTSVSKIKRHFRALLDETIADFNTKNSRSHLFENKFTFAGKYTFASADQLRATLHSPVHPYDQRRSFRSTFSGATGYYEFSRVGFNAAGDQALLYQVYECGEDCGSSTYYFYIKQNGAWKQKGKYVRFLS